MQKVIEKEKKREFHKHIPYKTTPELFWKLFLLLNQSNFTNDSWMDQRVKNSLPALADAEA